MAMVQTVQIVAPYLILDKHSDLGMCQPQEIPHSQRGIKRKITNTISSGPILAHLVTRRRKESEQNFEFGILLSDLLHQRTALLELAQRRDVYPHDPIGRRYRPSHSLEDVFSPRRPQLRLGIPQRGQRDQACIYGYTKII